MKKIIASGEEDAEYVLSYFKNLGEYEMTCFEDTENLFLDDMSVEEMKESGLVDTMGIHLMGDQIHCPVILLMLHGAGVHIDIAGTFQRIESANALIVHGDEFPLWEQTLHPLYPFLCSAKDSHILVLQILYYFIPCGFIQFRLCTFCLQRIYILSQGNQLGVLCGGICGCFREGMALFPFLLVQRSLLDNFLLSFSQRGFS